jgi:DNA damage-binding protein 1
MPAAASSTATTAASASSSGGGGGGLASSGSGSGDSHRHHPNHSTSTTPPEDLAEIGHVVFTALPAGSVSTSFQCSFLSSDSKDVIIVKSNRIEVRSYTHHGDTFGNNDNHHHHVEEDQFPLMLTLPINGRIVAIAPIRFPSTNRDCLLFTTEKGSYALISYDELLANQHHGNSTAEDEKLALSNQTILATTTTGEHYPIITHASGNFQNYTDHVLSGGRQCECGPLLSVDPLSRCVAMHLYDGYLTVLPINKGYDPFDEKARRVPWGKNNGIGAGGGSGGGGIGAIGGDSRVVRRGLSTGPFRDAMHLRLEERTILSMTFLEPNQQTKSAGNKYMPQLAIMHQDCYGYQHVVSHGIDLQRKKLVVKGANMDSKFTSSNPRSNASARGGRGAKGNNDVDEDDGYDDDDDGGGKPAAISPTMPPPGEQLTISKIEGGSGCLIAVPPPPPSLLGKGQELGGVLILGQRQVTYHSTAENTTLRAHTGGALLLSWSRVIDESYHSSRLYHYTGVEGSDKKDCASLRFLIGDERGRIHLLTLIRNKDGSSHALSFDTLGTASTSSSLVYLGKGRVFVGSSFGNSQLVKILDDPIEVGTVNGGLLAGDANTTGDPLADTTFVEVLEEYDNLGPIVDFDLRPCSDDNHDVDSPSKVGGKYRQSLVVTCSGVAKDGTVRLVRNGVGMREHASVDMEGIKGMWSLRRRFHEDDDSFLVQSFVRETRVLGVQSAKDVEMEDERDGDPQMEEEEGEGGGALAEVTIPGFNSSKSTLFSGNLMAGRFDLLLQVVDDGVRLVDAESLALLTQWSPFGTDDEGSDDDEPMGFITVASANESGQIIVALRGGTLVHLLVEEGHSSSSPIIRRVRKITLEREISCIDLNPFGSCSSNNDNMDAMDIDNVRSRREARKSLLVAVGLWDDFSVRLLNLNDDPSLSLEQVLHIHLGHGSGGEGPSKNPAADTESDDQLGAGGQHLMARSLCLVTMDSQSTNSNFINTKSMAPSSAPSNYLDMLLVGLGDGKLISFVLNQPGPSSNSWAIHSRKEVSLGTQGLHLIPFQHGSSKSSGSCVLATGDRPTVVYLTGGNAGSNSNPKLDYSTISLTVDDDEEGGHASHRSIAVNVAAPFRSSLLFSTGSANCSSLCMADENTLRLGMIDNIEKLHVTTFRLGMTPRRIAYHSAGRVYCVGCIAELELGGEANQNNCIRFFDDSTFEELNW